VDGGPRRQQDAPPTRCRPSGWRWGHGGLCGVLHLPASTDSRAIDGRVGCFAGCLAVSGRRMAGWGAPSM